MVTKRRAPRYPWSDNFDPLLPSPSARRLSVEQRSAREAAPPSAVKAEEAAGALAALPPSTTIAVKTVQSSALAPSSSNSVSSSLSVSSLSAPSAAAPATKLIEQCQCGHCYVPADCDDDSELCCCCDLVPPNLRDPDGSVCRSAPYTTLIATGPSADEYERFKSRMTRERVPPQSYAHCTPAQKRLVLYAVLHAMLYAGKGTKGQRDPLPECVKAAVRAQCSDSAVKVKSEGA